MIAFGLPWQKKGEPIGQRFAQLAAWLGREVGEPVTPRCALSYQELARMVRKGEVDVAWMPPVVQLALEDEHVAEPLVVHSRKDGYEAVLVARKGVESLDGARAAWVDPFSASGYLLPRVELANRGTTALLERFVGSHDAAVRALVEDRADVAGTFAPIPDDAQAEVRVLATLGPIPADVIAARSAISADIKTKLAAALVRAGTDAEAGPLVREVFGVDAFLPAAEATGEAAAQGALRRAIEVARSLGLLTG